MSYAEEIRKRVNSDTRTEPVKACIYARVSTDNEGQKESCANQVEMAKRYIAGHPNIELVNVYVDDGISGKNDFNRPAYGRMQQAIDDGNVELIIVKTTSRLNRDELNDASLRYFLKERKATILTLCDGQVQDFEDRNSQLIQGLRALIDSGYVYDQSQRGRETQQKRIANKELSAKDISFGYKWDKAAKAIVIDPEEAEVVRFIFEAYVYYGKTQAEIIREVTTRGYKRCPASLVKTLKDSRYIGEFPINKRTSQLGTGQTKTKRIELPQDQWVIVERPDLAIIDRELYELAQRKRAATMATAGAPKGKSQAYFAGTHLFSRRVFCKECQKSFQFGHADRDAMIPIYRIHSHQECASKINRVYEEDLIEIVKTAIRETIKGQENICEELEATLLACLRQAQQPSTKGEVRKLKQQKAAREQKRRNLIDAIANGGLYGPAAEALAVQMNSISEEIKNLEQTILEMENPKIDEAYIAEKILQIHEAINDLREFKTINRDQILNYVDKILVDKDGHLEVFLRTGTQYAA